MNRTADHGRRLRHATDLVLRGLGAAKRALPMGRGQIRAQDAEGGRQQQSDDGSVVHGVLFMACLAGYPRNDFAKGSPAGAFSQGSNQGMPD